MILPTVWILSKATIRLIREARFAPYILLHNFKSQGRGQAKIENLCSQAVNRTIYSFMIKISAK